MIGVGIACAPLSSTFAEEEALRESFTAPLGEVPPGWEWFDASPKNHSAAPPQITVAEGAEGLKFERVSRAWDNSAIFYTPRPFSDFTGSVVIRRQGVTNAPCIGIALRAQRPAYSFDGYYLVLRYTGKQRGLSVHENPQGYSEIGEELAFAPFAENLISGKDYLLKFSVVGKEIKASLWEKDGNVQLGEEVVYTQAEGLQSGLFGFRSGFSGGDDGKPVYFRDLEIHPVSAESK